MLKCIQYVRGFLLLIFIVSTPIPALGIDYFSYDEWGGTWHDADKSFSNSDDDYLCWAAAASNILAWTGWGTPELSTEAQIFQHFQDHWTDEGSTEDLGWHWWFDGSEPPDWEGWAQVDVPGGGAHWPTYNFFNYIHSDNNPLSLMNSVESFLRYGYGVTLGMYGGGGHSITAWGYEYDAAGNYTGVWVTDSDDYVNELFLLSVTYNDQTAQWDLGGYGYEGWYIGEVLALDRHITASAPTGLTASQGTYSDKISLQWNPSSDARFYQLFRNTTSIFDTATSITPWQNATNYDDTSVMLKTQYFYWVKAATSDFGTNSSPPSVGTTGYATPPVVFRSYLAEGYTGGTFRTYIALMNPSSQSHAVDVTFLTEDGTSVPYPVTLPATSRRVIDAGAIVPGQGFSTTVESSVQIPVERSMYWDAGGQSNADGHNAIGMSTLNTTWYLAEGYNSTNSSNFKTFLLLVNPNTMTATVSVTFLKEDGTTLPYTRLVPARSRSTIMTEALIPDGGFATKVQSDLPILVERALYWSAGGIANAGGHDTIGVSTLATTWFFAEGYNSSNFQTYLMLMNPNSSSATVAVTFMKEDGSNLPYTRVVPANSRSTILTDAVIPSGGFATRLQSDVPIVAERAMYWGAGGVPRAGGHDTIGVSGLATDWYFAEGYTGGTYETYLLLLNPNPVSADVAVKFIKDDGTVVPYSRTLAAHSRSTITVKSVIPSGGFATHVMANIPIMAERAMYWSAGGVTQAGGHCSSGIPYQSAPSGARAGSVPTYMLTVITAGSGRGMVTGTGIECGADCTELYPEGTILNLKAHPGADSSFVGWLINGDYLSGLVPVDRDMIVTAIFE